MRSVVLVLVLAGCGNSSSSDAGANDTGASNTDANQSDVHIPPECMSFCTTSPIPPLDSTCEAYLNAHCPDALAACRADTADSGASCQSCAAQLQMGGGAAGICFGSAGRNYALVQCACGL